MSGTIFRHELRAYLRSVITWSLSIVALTLVFTSLFSSFAQDAALLNTMMTKFPPALLAAFGLTGIDLATVLGYFSFVFLFVQICLAIQAANYGFSLVSIEEREWTADFLLAKPVGRRQIMTSKLLAALAALGITDVVVWISSIAFINLFRGSQTYDSTALLLLLASIAIFELFFVAVGLVISLLVKRVRSVTPYSMALAFGTYVLSAFGNMLGENVLEKLTPYRHFDPSYIIQHRAYNGPLVLIDVLVIIVSLVGSYWLYQRRDVATAV
jgi:ABC-2 type transport system permease protein